MLAQAAGGAGGLPTARAPVPARRRERERRAREGPPSSGVERPRAPARGMGQAFGAFTLIARVKIALTTGSPVFAFFQLVSVT